jgi:uncharacterized protein YbjT (DUF2867 family)
VTTNVDPDAGELVGLVYVNAFAPDAGETCLSLAGLFPGSTLGEALRPVRRSDGETIRLAPVFVQPESADDVAAALADVAVSEPVNGIVELAGPERFRLDELARRVLGAKNDPRPVAADVHARYIGAELEDHSLTPAGNARIAPTRFEDWLSASAAR